MVAKSILRGISWNHVGVEDKKVKSTGKSWVLSMNAYSFLDELEKIPPFMLFLTTALRLFFIDKFKIPFISYLTQINFISGFICQICLF